MHCMSDGVTAIAVFATGCSAAAGILAADRLETRLNRLFMEFSRVHVHPSGLSISRYFASVIG